MPLPSSIVDLSTSAASNSPAGGDSIGTSLDDYLRAIQAIMKQQFSTGTQLSSGTTITPQADGNFINVTGTSSITTIASTNSWNGRIIVLKFADALTLTHSANLVLPNTTNITTAANEVFSFVQESTGVWRCISAPTSVSRALAVLSIDIGHASDTTLTRASAGTLAVEGANLLTTATGAAIAGSASQAFSASNFTTAQGLQFPATQNPSADANALDDYEEGTWTPALTFDTPGDLSVAYTYQLGRYTKIGRTIIASFAIVTSTFTHTTASGNLRITGCPFTSANVQDAGGGALTTFRGITKAGGYTQYASAPVANHAYMIIYASGSGAEDSTVAAADMPTGTEKYFYCEFSYQI